MKHRISAIIDYMRRENLFTLLFIIFTIVIVSGLAMTIFEPDVSFVSGIWWSIVTLTTVGYGDISPSSAGGRVVAVVIMFFGIGLLGMLSASLAAIMVSKRIKEEKGMGKAKLNKHIIICEWNHRSRAVIREFRSDEDSHDVPIVLIADIDEKPLDDPNLFFIKGSVNEESLEKANLEKATTVVVLGNDELDPTARDAKVVLTTLTIESMCPNVYTVVELVDKKNEQHCKRANADEIIVGSEISSHLLATAVMDHGMSTIVSELLSARYGNDLFAMPAGKAQLGSSFLDVMVEMKKEYNATVLGIQKGAGGELISNPDQNYSLEQGDYLVLMATSKPDMPN